MDEVVLPAEEAAPEQLTRSVAYVAGMIASIVGYGLVAIAPFTLVPPVL